MNANSCRLLCILFVQTVLGSSFNRPPLCPNVLWNNNGTAVLNSSTINSNLTTLFIDQDNQLYYAEHEKNQLIMWSLRQETPTTIGFKNETYPTSIFRDGRSDTYVAIGGEESGVYRFSSSSQHPHRHTSTDGSCWDIFVVQQKDVYCSLRDTHQVVLYRIRNTNESFLIFGKNATCGSEWEALCSPSGIYVWNQRDLFVADMGNDRIQWFRNHSTIGETFVGSNGSLKFYLNKPTSIIRDGLDAWWIADSGSNRIVRCSGSSCSCYVGCDNGNESSLMTLFAPTHLTFDQYGNLFVLHRGPEPVIKYALERNTCYFYPRINLCQNATWEENATTLVNRSVIGLNPYSIFIDEHNKIYITNPHQGKIMVMQPGNESPERVLHVNVSLATHLFVDRRGDVYFESGKKIGRIEKWPIDANHSIPVAQFPRPCYGLFIDLNNTLYCSCRGNNTVMAVSLDDSKTTPKVVAGTYSSGSGPNQLHNPWRIFVDQAYNLYVADASNNRIQQFKRGENNGITLVPDKTSNNVVLEFPTDFFVANANTFYIADAHHHRIVLVQGNTSRTIAGVRGFNGSQQNWLSHAVSFKLALHSNDLYVVDEKNNRIQVFSFIKASCPPQTEQESSTTSMDFPVTTIASSDHPWTPSTRLPTVDPIFRTACSFHPCENGGNCSDDASFLGTFSCECPLQVHGQFCQHSDRPCDPNPCQNGGVCNGFSKTDQYCSCSESWTGRFCHIKVNFCPQKTCYNRGQCRPLVGHSKCECLEGSYTGDQCEKEETHLKIRRFIAKSFAYVAILAMLSVALFVIIMDILKYVFGIDPVEEERERMRQEKRRRKRTIQHFVYVNRPEDLSPERRLSRNDASSAD